MAVARESKTFQVKHEIHCFNECCRVCMGKDINMTSVFSNELSRAVEELQFITGILITQDDDLPTKLCEVCLKMLSVAYKFKTTCLQSDEMFRNMLKQNNLKSTIKVEIDENGDDGNEIDVDDDSHHEAKQEVRMDSEEQESFDSGDDLKTKPPNRVKTARARQKKALKKCKAKDNGDPEHWTKRKSKDLYCEVCDLKFANKDLSLEHKRDVHGCDWICEICGKQFMYRASHYSHMRSHSPPQYKCAQCSYRTWHKADMNKHIRTHTGDKLYVCEYCTSSFNNTSNLYGHIRRNHGGVKTHFCPRCDLSFFSGDKLRRHLDSHDNIKRHECDVCHAQFTRRCHWKKHLQKQHSIVVPQIRPGRRKVNIVKGDEREEQVSIVEVKKT